jgi:ribosomal protein L40E
MRESAAGAMLGNTDSSLAGSVFSVRYGILTWCDPVRPEVSVWCCPECGWWQHPGAEECRRCGWRQARDGQSSETLSARQLSCPS